MWRTNKQHRSTKETASVRPVSKRKSVTSESIAARDMSLKTKVIKKAAEHISDGKAEVTTVWNVDVSGKQTRISFSRDNLGVWINGSGVVTKAFISDQGYDVDLFFDVDLSKCHIFSDVEGNQMMNYLLVDEQLVGYDHQDYQVEKK